jgi:hypothetical protein
MGRFGNHRVIRPLGSGAAGDVYEVEDLLTGEYQALKVLRDPTPAALLRFKREFRCMRDLVHPNLVGLHHLAVDGERAWFTMDLVPGTDLIYHLRGRAEVGPADDTIESSLEERRCDVERLRECLRQLALGLGAVHAAGKVHRDLKPSNVRVRPDGRLVVLDFGLVLDQLDPLRTGAGLAIGTPAYMAPEQVTGRGVRASDWYAVGVMLFEALTGRLPFDGHVVEVLCQRLQREPPAPSTLVPDVDPQLDQLCVDLLRLDPCARPTAAQVLARVTDGERTSSISSARPDRARQRARLASLAGGVGARGAVVVGPAAAGKRPLLREVAVEAHDRGAAVMCSRCHRRERLPFQIFDGVVDALTRHWSGEERLPVEAVILAGIFPVLRSIPRLADADPLPTATAFTVGRALAACLATLSERCKVVVCIVDIDRSDTDSREALAELFASPELPPVCFLFSATSTDCLPLPDWMESVEVEALDVEADLSVA